MTESALLELYDRVIPDTWIDYNGHMNVAYYVLAFDETTDVMLDALGMDSAYRADTGCSVFVLETHVNYFQELMLGERVRCSTQILDADSKRIHYFHRMFRGDEEEPVATTELLLIHMDMTARHSRPFPEHIQCTIDELLATHGKFPRPLQVGRTIGIRHR